MKAIISEIRTCKFTDLNDGDVFRRENGAKRYVKTYRVSAIEMENFREVIKILNSGEIAKAVGVAGQDKIPFEKDDQVEIVGKVFIEYDVEVDAGPDRVLDYARMAVERFYLLYDANKIEGDIHATVEIFRKLRLMVTDGGTDEG